MRVTTHRRIVRVVGEALNLQSEVLERLERYVVLPDSARGRSERHHAKSNIYRAVSLLLEARREYVKGNTRKALEKLGFAIHLLHDMLIPSPRRVGARKHSEIEKAVDSQPIPIYTIESAKQAIAPSIKILVEDIPSVIQNPGSRSIVDAATEVTTLAVGVVLSNPPLELKNLRDQVYECKHMLGEIEKRKGIRELSILAIVSGILTPILIFSRSHILATLYGIIAVASLLGLRTLKKRAFRELTTVKPSCKDFKKIWKERKTEIEYLLYR